jgi:3-hydroxyacyl-CoA dehydrogenase
VRDSTLLDKLCEAGRFGQKSGAGWYRYEEGSRIPRPDPAIEQLIVEHSKEIGLSRRQISDEEILSRCILALINEGGHILDEGVAAREVDVDMVWVHGYGFPAHRGGPLHHARAMGYRTVLQGVLDLQARFGAHFWRPSDWLRMKAAQSERGAVVAENAPGQSLAGSA